MSQFISLLKILTDELQGQKDLHKLLIVEKSAIAEVKKDKVDELQKSKSILLERLQEYATSRDALVRAILHIEDAKKPAKATEAVLKCTDVKLRKQLQGLINSLRTLSAQVQEQNTYNARLVNQALGILSSTLAIIRSTPGTELPTYGGQGKLTSNVADPAFQKRKTLVTTA
jgi:flagellar biosynthesis/type III secretory pathway chaperone